MGLIACSQQQLSAEIRASSQQLWTADATFPLLLDDNLR